MKLHYRRIEHEIHIVRCFSENPAVHIPAFIDGVPVTTLCAYVFSPYKTAEETDILCFQTDEPDSLSDSGTTLMTGSRLKEIYLSEQLRIIENYAFYGCTNLKKLAFSNQLASLGGGVFIDCKPSEIELTFRNTETSRLKDITDELKNAIQISVFYESGDSSRLLFPAYYEEDIENGPARIFETHYLGSGYPYRQCFFKRELDYHAYDKLFPIAAARESFETTVRIALNRLSFPYRLTETAAAQYRGYLCSNSCDTAAFLIRQDCFEEMRFLAAARLLSAKAFDTAVEIAGASGKTDIVSWLIQEKQSQYPPRTKTFIF